VLLLKSMGAMSIWAQGKAGPPLSSRVNCWRNQPDTPSPAKRLPALFLKSAVSLFMLSPYSGQSGIGQMRSPACAPESMTWRPHVSVLVCSVAAMQSPMARDAVPVRVAMSTTPEGLYRFA
jgi:hypothetical protein